MFATRSARAKRGLEGGHEGADDDFVARGDVGIGATIIGRNVFGPDPRPVAGRVVDWLVGAEPTVSQRRLRRTHHRREPLAMEGGTTFHFINDTADAVLRMAFNAANGQDVMLGGGAATIQQFLRAGLIDEMHVVIVPIMLGDGERLFDNLAGRLDQYECVELVSSNAATHARITRSPR
jgi:dihydrofolate reductase